MSDESTMVSKLSNPSNCSLSREENYGDGKWISVTNGNCDELAGIAGIAKKHNTRFCVSDFKDGDVIRLKDDEHVVRIRGGAALFVHLLFQFDERCTARDKLLHG